MNEWAKQTLKQLPTSIFLTLIFFSLTFVLEQPSITQNIVPKREFDPTDPSLSYISESSIVPYSLVVVGLISVVMFSPLLAMHISPVLSVELFLSSWLCVSIQYLFASFLKVATGRLRPDFLSRCQWDSTLEECTGSPSAIFQGRLSFPSGHSTASMCASMLLASTMFCVFVNHRNDWHPRALRAVISVVSTRGWVGVSFLPILFGLFVGISRTLDHHHHATDVGTGMTIGATFAVAAVALAERNFAKYQAEKLGSTDKGRVKEIMGDHWLEGKPNSAV
ncbi:PAP2 superfamily [Carpediemonas membranifera]|uniref:PAP2 superfamily n=1 Tax=Carpediemonas membranifera TaxID=201153 RepID=A0A8J6DYR4_9EUKA|nr:PAP2 superfamily [Carpediemonas membranifera]|eukprot:KAG9389456.1 PAP2 superfamily [Carpediemonas membranifera]